MKDYKFLTPYTFNNGSTIKNRIAIPPMTDCSAFHDGTVTQDELEYYACHSGGIGLFISSTAYVSDNGKGYEGQLSVAHNYAMPGLIKMAHSMKQNGTKAILQLFHAGRLTSSAVLRGKHPKAPSAIAAPGKNKEVPEELTNEEIQEIIDAFGKATTRAIKAGFDGVEIHGANGYLFQEFFSAASNHRTDEWGGSFENRIKFPLAVIKSVTDAVKKSGKKDFIVGYRISPEEVGKDGITIDDTLKFVDILGDQPINYLHVSMGNVWRTSIRDKNVDEPVNSRIKKVLNGRAALIGVGSVKKPEEAEKVIESGLVDIIAMGRESLVEPNWVEKVESGHEDAIRYDFVPTENTAIRLPYPFAQFFDSLIGDPENDAGLNS